MRTYILILLSMFIFLPVSLFAEETYFDLEQVEVEELPEASSETVDKVYVLNDEYYVTEVDSANYTPLPLNEEILGKTIYFNFPEDFYLQLESNFSSGTQIFKYQYMKGSGIQKLDYGYFNIDTTRYILTFPCKNDLKVDYPSVYEYDTSSGIVTNLKSCIIGFKSHYAIRFHIVNEFVSPYVSLTPFDTSYSWKKVDKSQVVQYKVDNKDFHLYYTFEDISQFNIFSNFDFGSFNDFEKLVITGIFNLLYLGTMSLSVYIGLKCLNKGLSILGSIFGR